MKDSGPKVLVFDIETAPILAYVWKIWDENVGINQIDSDWYILSWAAKWLGKGNKVMYQDQRNAKPQENDTEILKGIWKLLDEADVVITQNGRKFDQKKLNARFVMKGFQPPSAYKHIDTFLLAKKHFGFTSNKLEFMTNALCKKYKKLKSEKFVGFELWKQCLANNPEAWKEMEKYNKYDVLSLEELYNKLIAWDSGFNPNLYYEGVTLVCTCGSDDFIKRGFFYTSLSKYQRYRCKACGAETRGREDMFSKEKKKSLTRGVAR